MIGAEEGGWIKTDHACRFCAARVLTRGDVYACSSCAAETRGGPVGICGCGMHLGPVPKTAKQIEQMKQRHPQGFHCTVNLTPTPLSPALVLISFAGKPSTAPLMRLEPTKR